MNLPMLLLSLGTLSLALTVLFQRYAFRTGIQKQLKKISEKLCEIIDTGSDEPLLIFTDHRELMELAAQINRLLEERRRMQADCRRFQNTSRKMLSNISHDIRTPMTVILGYLEILQTPGKHPDEQAEMLKRTEQKAQSLMELISRFFTLAKLESGDMELPLSRIDACEICRESILDFYEILSEHDFHVEIQIPETPAPVMGNKEALQRILSNLISNAIRYGSEGSYLGIAAETDERFVSICVTDHGQGIDRASADHVFDRLFTLEDSRSRNIQGSGLGLTIARHLALQMNGELLLNSIPHVKTTFMLRLPLW